MSSPRPSAVVPSVKQFLAQPVPYRPGTHFLYNTMGSYVLIGHRHQGDTGQTTLGISPGPAFSSRFRDPEKSFGGMKAPRATR